MLVAATLVFLSGCYTLTQGVEQARLLARRVPIQDVITEGRESPDRINKLRLVPHILNFARERVGLTPGSSYQTYIPLERTALSYVVQASEKRQLKLKTWWFPIVGRQPYLGFFDRQKAKDFQQSLVAEGYDTVMGGVQAFSLLGFFPDPVYSSMVDSNDPLGFVELLFHETLHRTIYVPDAYTFNENLAEFVARHATLLYLKEHGSSVRALDASQDEAFYLSRHEKMQRARQAFSEFLDIARQELTAFYAQPAIQALDESKFLRAREEKVAALNAQFESEFGSQVKDTHYSAFFQPARFNNASLLAASVYEARQEPFVRLLERNGADLAKFLQALKKCVSEANGSEKTLWSSVETCGG